MEKQQKENWVSSYPFEFTNFMVDEILDNPQTTILDEIPQGFGRFGLDETNPIPVFGIPATKLYMNRLRLSDGQQIRWIRIGSTVVKNIKCPVDIYEVNTLVGNKVAILYLSPYHLRTSNNAPAGFILIDS